MKKALLCPVILVAFVAGSLLPGQARSQPWVRDSVCPDDNHAAFHACALEAASDFEAPRNAYGDPDLSGIWRRRAAAHESIEAHVETLDDNGGPSIIVDPPSGVAPMQPWAEAQRRQNRAQYVHHNAICRLDGVPLTMYMTGTLQFLQNADYFLVQGEEAHAYRMIRVDGSSGHIGEDIRLWNGDSRGYWDGSTLVVETANQNARAWLDQRGRFFTDEARVVERFTLIDANTLHYQATLDDPNVYTQPFTIAFAYRRADVDSWELLEEACYENNEHARARFFNVGYEIYPGITGAEARRLRSVWEVEEGETR